MADELARLGAGRGEAKAVDDVVEPALQRDQQLLAGAAASPTVLVGFDLGNPNTVVAKVDGRCNSPCRSQGFAALA